MARGGWKDDDKGMSAYAGYLMALAANEKEWERAGLVGLAKGWVIGTAGWRKTLAKEHAQRRLESGMAAQERKELREAAWAGALEEKLRDIGRSENELITKPRKQAWKLDLAMKLRDECGASIAWLARHLHLGQPTTVRSYLHLWKRTIK